MTVLEALSKPLLLVLVLLVSGCGSQLQKSFNRSVMIAQHCTAIEEAVPVRERELGAALVNAISVRLVATCANGSQNCLNPASSPTDVPDPFASALQLQENLKTHRKQFDVLNRQFVQANQATVTTLQGQYDELDKKFATAHTEALQALVDLRKALEAAQASLGTSLSEAGACQRRTRCVARLAQRLASVRTTIEGKIAKLRERAERLHALAQDAVLLTGQTASFVATVPTALAVTADAHQQTAMSASEQLRQDTGRLAASGARFVERLQAGARALENLFNAEVQEAATDFMAARLYDKAADRTLAAIDRMLARVDRTIDQVDEHVYGAATIGAYVFEGEMQDRLDQLFRTLVVDRIPDNKHARTAKLAFAAAACRRLLPEDGREVQNASMFSPFVFATLVNIEADLEGLSREKVRQQWEARLAAPLGDTEAAGKQFIERVADVYVAESSTEHGNKPVAPSMLQQVALCANVEQELASTQQLGPNELAARTRAVCGKAVVAATMRGEALPEASNPALARLAIETAKPDALESGPSGQPGAQDAAAWRRAMEAVLAAAAPKQPSPLELLCQRIKNAGTTTRCDADGTSGAVTLDFAASFATGKRHDPALELHMVRLAEMLSEGKQNYVVTVYGYASASPFACGRRPSGAATCTGDRNGALAKERADWALGVLRQRLGGRMGAGSVALGKFDPLSFDTPADRRIRMIVALRD